MKRGLGGLLILAIVLLAATVALDQLWYQPQKANVNRLIEERARIQEAAAQAEQNASENRDMMAYFEQREEPGVDWLERYRGQDALDVLERVRGMSGVRRRALNLERRDQSGPFLKTTYYMSVTGTFNQQIKFLRELELSLPVVSVDAFALEPSETGPSSRLTLNLNTTVSSLGETP